MKHVIFITLLISSATAQVLPSNRSVNWNIAGYKGTIPNYTTVVDINNFGGDNSGIASNNTAFTNAVNSLAGANGVIFFPTGTYLFTSSINLRSGLILRGVSSDSTILKFNLGGGNSNDAIDIIGANSTTQSALSSYASKDSMNITAVSSANLSPGDYIQLSFNDSSLVFSNWAYGSVGQIIKINSIVGNKLFLESPLRLDYNLLKNPKITKLNPILNVGIECLKINRFDASTNQTSNINFNYAAQCWIKGIESDSCNFSHIELNNSTNITINNSYFHDAKAYGGGGQAYGVVCQFTSGECLIENNVFKHLRHSMLLQAGSNGNVFGYNYSINAFWTGTSLPSNSSGDAVLHGNYPYANLFEGNICQNIVIDDSHGINGNYNTFFRNRAELYGIFMNSNPASNNQNFIGNEITNTGLFLGLYFLNGSGHFEHGNNVKGTIYASGTNTLTDQSYYYTAQPSFLLGIPNWPSIGISNPIGSGTIPAKQRYLLNNYTLCNSLPTLVNENNYSNEFIIYPNPSEGLFKIKLKTKNTITKFVVYSITGNIVNEYYFSSKEEQTIDLSGHSKGIYFIKPFSSTENYVPIKIVLQ